MRVEDWFPINLKQHSSFLSLFTYFHPVCSWNFPHIIVYTYILSNIISKRNLCASFLLALNFFLFGPDFAFYPAQTWKLMKRKLPYSRYCGKDFPLIVMPWILRISILETNQISTSPWTQYFELCWEKFPFGKFWKRDRVVLRTWITFEYN